MPTVSRGNRRLTLAMAVGDTTQLSKRSRIKNLLLPKEIKINA